MSSILQSIFLRTARICRNVSEKMPGKSVNRYLSWRKESKRGSEPERVSGPRFCFFIGVSGSALRIAGQFFYRPVFRLIFCAIFGPISGRRKGGQAWRAEG